VQGVWCVSEVKLAEAFHSLPNFMCDNFQHNQTPIIFNETITCDKQFGVNTPVTGAVR